MPLQEEAQKPMHRVWSDRRVLMFVSVVLAVCVWLWFAVIHGETRDEVIKNVPITLDMRGSVVESLGLSAFWQTPEAKNLTVDVTIRCRRYENITAKDLRADLVLGEVYRSGEFSVPVHADSAVKNDKRFQIVGVSVRNVPLFFAPETQAEFVLHPVLQGEPEPLDSAYRAAPVRLSKEKVRISGPSQMLSSVQEVQALVQVETPLQATAEFADVKLVALNAQGLPVDFVRINPEGPAVHATIPVWKTTTVVPQVEFLQVPESYLTSPLQATLAPAMLEAALPEEDVLGDGMTYVVGAISFLKLAPGHTRFKLPASDLPDVLFLDGTQHFVADVDLTGFATRTFVLPAAQIRAAQTDAALRFRAVRNVVVVGPEASLETVTAADLQGVADNSELTPDNIGNRLELKLQVQVGKNDCWVFGESYSVQAYR